jgi:hypothetical protein
VEAGAVEAKVPAVEAEAPTGAARVVNGWEQWWI